MKLPQKIKIVLPYIPAISRLGYISKETEFWISEWNFFFKEH